MTALSRYIDCGRPQRGRCNPTSTVQLLSISGILMALAGCADQDPDRFAPPCPTPSIPRDFSDLHRFQGTGRDITDSVVEGRITGLQGACTRDTRTVTVVTVSVGIELTRGPASPSRTADIPYFVAVSDGDTILDKRVYTLRAEFPPNTDRLRLSGDEVELRLPVTEKKTAAAYSVYVGFQLTPAELAVNRPQATPPAPPITAPPRGPRRARHAS